MEWGIGVLDLLDSIRIDVDPKASVPTAGKSNARCEPRRTEADDCDTGHAGPNQPRGINVPRSSSIRERFVCRLRADSASSSGSRDSLERGEDVVYVLGSYTWVHGQLEQARDDSLRDWALPANVEILEGLLLVQRHRIRRPAT